MVLLAVTSIFILFAAAWDYYERYKVGKEYELSQIRIVSPKLETAKFFDLKLGSSIGSYRGFKLLESSGDNFYDESLGEQAYGYFGRDSKYSRIGEFHLSDPISEAIELGVKTTASQIANSSRVKLSIFTFNKKIYKIEAVIKEYTDGNFNDIFKTAYGPAALDNGHNKIRYFSDDEIQWESSNVLLTTYGETKPTYYEGRLSMIPNKHRYITYLSKPLKALMDSAQSAKSAERIDDAINKL